MSTDIDCTQNKTTIQFDENELLTTSLGTQGVAGIQGEAGEGVASGGTTSQILVKSSATDYDTEWTSNPTIDSIQFNLSAVIAAHATGKLHWDSDSGTLELGMLGSDVRLQIGQETLIYVRNNTGSTIVNGTIVYISGGVGNKPTIGLADNSSAATSNIIGLTTEDISNNTEGYVTIFGLVRELDTSSYSAGDTLFLGATGLITSTKPSAPLISAKLGVCIYGHPTAGVILVNTQVVPKLVNLSDVDNALLADTYIPYWDSASGTFKFKSESGGGLYGANFEALSADKTLVPNTDKIYQHLDANGGNRIITLDTASATLGDRFVIKHGYTASYADTYYLEIKQGGTSKDYVYAGKTVIYIFDGTDWVSNDIIDFSSSGLSNNVQIGHQAKVIGKGVAVGRKADGSDFGVAVGLEAIAKSFGFASGSFADTNLKKYSNAISYYAKCERYGETSINIDGSSDQENNHGLIGLAVDTTDATPTVMLAGGYSAQKLTIRASSILMFDIQVTARDNTSGDCAAYKITGAIKRDASNNTAIVGSVNYDVIAEDDVSWNIAVTADDTNEALQIEVTGDATNPVQWVASVKYVETHF